MNSMDLSKPNTAKFTEHDAETVCDSADSRQAIVEPVIKPMWVDDTSLFKVPLRPPNTPKMRIISDSAGNVSAINVPDNDPENVSNPVASNVDEGTSCPQKWSQMSDVANFGVSRKQRRKEAFLRKKMQQPPGPPEPEAGCSNRKRSFAMTADSSQTGTEIKRMKMPQTESPSNEKVAIIPVNFPSQQILQNHIGAIQEAVMLRLDLSPDPLPQVTCGALLGGALFFNCVGRDAVNWLADTMSERMIGGLNLKVVDAKDLPKPVKMAWKTKIVGDHDIKLLLRVLQRFNPGLNTDQWKVIDTSLDNMTSRRIILMDRASADVIRDAGYCLNSGVDMSTFKLLEDSGSKSLETNPPGSGGPFY